MTRYRPGCIFEQHGVWRIRFGKEPSKRLGTTKELPTKAHVMRAARPYIDAANAEKPLPTKTMGQVIDRYRNEVMSKRASTARTDSSWIKNHIEPTWASTPLAEFGRPPEKVSQWLMSLPISTTSRRQIRSILRGMIKAASVWGWLEDKPHLSDITIKKQKGETIDKARILPVPELRLLVAKLDEPFKTMAHIAYFGGMRISELFGLRWGDIDWLRKQLTIRTSVVNQIADETKTPASEATMPLSDEELEMLKLWRQSSEFTESQHYVFASPFKAGELPYSYTGFSKILKRACRDAGIEGITPHSFRHSLRAWLKEMGISAEQQVEMMRHTDFNQTKQYGAHDKTVSPRFRETHDRLVKEALR
jgi:integrase